MTSYTCPHPTDRQAVIESAANRQYDLAVVGGGIAGAGIARDAAMRGLDTLLLEKHDFASGTTANTTRLIHGGLRYLEQLDFRLVFESLQERETLVELAPHLVEPLSFVIPQYDESLFYRLKVRLGLLLYDLLSYNKSMPWHEHLGRAEVIDREPALPEDGLQGGVVYHDRQAAFVERLCLETVLDAAHNGADVLNHAEATSIRTIDGTVTGVAVRDRLGETSFEVEAAAVANAAGPWADDVAGAYSESRLVRPTKGIHLVVPKLTEHALTLPTTDDRVIFTVPWHGLSLVGTTDTEYDDDPADAAATAADVDYLLAEARRFFPALEADDILYTYAGVRPLYHSGGAEAASDVSRRHRVIDHDGPAAGLFSLIGAKVTPHRAAAEDLTDAVAEYLGVDAPCRTADVPLPGARGDDVDEADVPSTLVHHLEGLYGSRTSTVLERIERDERLAEPLCVHTTDVLAQVTVAVEEEYARTVTDVLFRRCTVGYAECEGRDAVETVADHMADLLDWDAARRQTEIDRYESVIDRRHRFAEESASTRP